MEDEDVVWLCLMMKINHLQLPKVLTISKFSSSEDMMNTLEALTYNKALNEEIEALKSIFGEENLNTEKLMIFDKGCCKLEFKLDSYHIDLLVYIYDATSYPLVSSGFQIFGCITTTDVPNARDVCLTAMKETNGKVRSGEPVLYDFVQRITDMMTDGNEVVQPPLSLSTPVATTNNQSIKPKSSNLLASLDYRTAYSRALSMADFSISLYIHTYIYIDIYT